MSTKKKSAPSETDLGKAVSHPLRSEILTALGKRTASPSDIAKELGAPLTDVSHHVKRLVELGCAELVEEKKARGWNKSLYRATIRNLGSEEVIAAMHPAVAGHYAGQALHEIGSAVKRGIESKSLDPQGPIELSCTEVNVDEEGYLEILEIIERARNKAMEVAGRTTEGKDKRGPISLSLLCFRLPESE